MTDCRSKPESPARPGAQAEYRQLSEDDSLASFNGQKVQVEGRISDTPWQHLINIPEAHPEIAYFDLAGGAQIVVYSREKIPCLERSLIKGTVIEIKGESKRPGSKDEVREYQIVVDAWECLPALKLP
jgi:hypothetical protein